MMSAKYFENYTIILRGAVFSWTHCIWHKCICICLVLLFWYKLCCVIVVAKLSGSSTWLKISNIPPQVCV